MMNLFPLPNYSDPTDPDNLENYQAFSTNKFRSHRFDTRVDVALGANDNLYVNFSRSVGRDENTGGLIPEITGNVEDTSWLTSVSYARIFTPTLTNELVVAFGRGSLCVPDQATVDYMHQTDTLRAKYFNNLGEGEDLGLYMMNLDGYYALFLQTESRRLGYSIDDAFYGEETAWLEALRARWATITAAEVNTAIRTHLDPARLQIAIVGPNGAALADALGSEAASPMSYDEGVSIPEEVLAILRKVLEKMDPGAVEEHGSRRTVGSEEESLRDLFGARPRDRPDAADAP